MHVTTMTAETAVETCDPNILALAMALAGYLKETVTNGC
jgi:hypothetical protein